MTKTETSVGLIGLGEIGARAHCPALIRETQRHRLRLIAIADPTHSKKKDQLPESLIDQLTAVDFTVDYHELLARADIDAISVATPPNTHYEIATVALHEGKHVMLEKPPT